MKKIKLKVVLIMALIMALLPFSSCDSTNPTNEPNNAPEDAPAPWGPTPSEAQLAYQKQELSAFIHFGMNTFNGQEWGTGKEDPSKFALESIDTDQWVKTYKEAGFGRIILVAKHHDGFCNWLSELTEHCVKNSPYKIDVVGELSKSCTKYDLDMGVYLSPFDMNQPTYSSGNHDEYNEYYMGQLKEILGNPDYGNNGKFAEVWMDGASPSGQKYYFTSDYVSEGKENWFDVIKSFNKDTVIFCPIGATVRWNGTESGYSRIPCWNKINWSEQKKYYDEHYGENEAYVGHGDPEGENWSVPEADVSLVPGWFDYKGTPKTLEALGDIYFSSVGRGCVLLLNAAPGTDGRISDAQEKRITEFGEAIRNTFKDNLALDASVEADSVRNNNDAFKASNVTDDDYDTYWTMNNGQTTGSITIDLGEEKTFNVVSVQEYIPLGQRVSKFNIEVFSNGAWKNFGDPLQNGQTIGYKALVRDGAVTASKVRLNITESQAVPVINSIGVYKADKAFEVQTLDVPAGAKFIDDKDFRYTGKWTEGSGMQSIYDTHTWSASGKELTAAFDFTGNSFYIVGIEDPGHGEASVWVDGVEIGTATFKAKDRRGHQLIYSSPALEYGEHKVTLKTKGAPIDIDGVYYVDAGGNVPAYSLKEEAYNVSKDEKTLSVTIVRSGDLSQSSSVRIYTEPGTGVQGKVFTHKVEVIEFASGETEKTIQIELLGNIDDSSKDFYVKIDLENNQGILSIPNKTTVTVS